MEGDGGWVMVGMMRLLFFTPIIPFGQKVMGVGLLGRGKGGGWMELRVC